MLIAGRPVRLRELQGRIDVDVEYRANLAVLGSLAKGVANARRHAIPRVGEIARTPGELIKPVGGSVNRVEDVGAVTVPQARIPRLLRKHVGIRLNHVLPGFVQPRRAATREGNATLENRAEDAVARLPGTRTPVQHGVAAVVPVSPMVAHARNDGKHVEEAVRRGQTVIGVEA